MTVKELIKRLSRYSENAEVGAIHCDSSFCDGDITTDFSICSRKHVAKRNVGDGFEDTYNDCDVLICIQLTTKGNIMSDYYLGMSSKILPDYAKVFKPAPYIKFVSKLIDAAPTSQYARYFVDSWNGNTCAKYSDANVDKFSKFITRTLGNLYVKMLVCMEDEPCSYHEIYHRLLKSKGKPFGNDVESFKNLEINGLVEIDHLGKYKRKYMRLTPLGRIVLENAKKNDVAYKVLRHFMKFKDDFDSYLVEVNFNIETMDDISPNSFVDMLAAILDDNSAIHEIGSYAYWCNKLIDTLKKNERFFEMFDCPEVNTWLDNNSSNLNVQNFKKIFDKISKKHARKAAQKV